MIPFFEIIDFMFHDTCTIRKSKKKRMKPIPYRKH